LQVAVRNISANAKKVPKKKPNQNKRRYRPGTVALREIRKLQKHRIAHCEAAFLHNY